MFQYKRLLLMFLITGLIPMVIFTYVAYSIAASSVRKDFQRQNYSFLTITQHHLTTHIFRKENMTPSIWLLLVMFLMHYWLQTTGKMNR